MKKREALMSFALFFLYLFIVDLHHLEDAIFLLLLSLPNSFVHQNGGRDGNV